MLHRGKRSKDRPGICGPITMRTAVRSDRALLRRALSQHAGHSRCGRVGGRRVRSVTINGMRSKQIAPKMVGVQPGSVAAWRCLNPPEMTAVGGLCGPGERAQGRGRQPEP
jgi:hypothetical protein